MGLMACDLEFGPEKESVLVYSYIHNSAENCQHKTWLVNFCSWLTSESWYPLMHNLMVRPPGENLNFSAAAPSRVSPLSNGPFFKVSEGRPPRSDNAGLLTQFLN